MALIKKPSITSLGRDNESQMCEVVPGKTDGSSGLVVTTQHDQVGLSQKGQFHLDGAAHRAFGPPKPTITWPRCACRYVVVTSNVARAAIGSAPQAGTSISTAWSWSWFLSVKFLA